MSVSPGVSLDGSNCNPTGELGRSNFEGFQFFATPDERSGIVANPGVVENQDLERRDRRVGIRGEEGLQIRGPKVG